MNIYLKYGKHSDMSEVPVYIELNDERVATVGASDYVGDFDIKFTTEDEYYEWLCVNRMQLDI